MNENVYPLFIIQATRITFKMKALTFMIQNSVPDPSIGPSLFWFGPSQDWSGSISFVHCSKSKIQ